MFMRALRIRDRQYICFIIFIFDFFCLSKDFGGNFQTANEYFRIFRNFKYLFFTSGKFDHRERIDNFVSDNYVFRMNTEVRVWWYSPEISSYHLLVDRWSPLLWFIKRNEWISINSVVLCTRFSQIKPFSTPNNDLVWVTKRMVKRVFKY